MGDCETELLEEVVKLLRNITMLTRMNKDNTMQILAILEETQSEGNANRE